MFKIFQKFLFYFKSQTAHGLHSPLVFDLYNQILNPNLNDFKEEKFLNDLKIYLQQKPEIKDNNILIINNLYNINSSNIEQNNIVYISNPYENKNTWAQTKRLISEPHWIYIIDFFEGILLITVPLKPRQFFYLRKM